MNLQTLNPSQREAVEYIHGPELIIAGAGSGKTRVLTYKIAYLMEQGIHPGNILALTFTNKAAREMKSRVRQLLPQADARYLWMGTFHSIAARLLRTEAESLGFTKDFTIYDTTDSKAVVKHILKEKKLDEKTYKTGTVLGKISAAKNALITPEEYAQRSDIYRMDREQRMYEMPAVYKRYQQTLRDANAMDFDDLLVNLCKLLQTDEAARTKYQDAFRYILVDEYQDTNYVQYMLVRLLAEPDNNICVVGDDAQSIYAFRGADIRNILNFQKTYPNARLYKLERNYRSTRTIVQAANSLIHHNEHQIHKDVYSEKEQGTRIDITRYTTDRDEGESIAMLIRREDLGARKYSPEDIAILYRTNSQSRVFENALRQLSIPYRIYGGTSFYQRKEVKNVIAYFRLAVNPADDASLRRIINTPARGIGETTQEKVAACATAHAVSMFEVACNPVMYGLPVSKATATKLTQFAAIILRFQEYADEYDAYQFADKVLHESGLATAAAMDQSPEGIEQAQYQEELLSSIHEYVNTLAEGTMTDETTPPKITDFLSEVALLTDQDEKTDDQTPRVTLMTVHAAKGLEFPVVYVVGMEENLFPSQLCNAPQEIEEERRLLYVAITRAMEVCRLSFAQQRFRNGQVAFSSPSRFLGEIDRDCVRIVQPNSPYQTFRPVENMRFSPVSSGNNIPDPTPEPAPKPRKLITAEKSGALDAYRSGERVAHKTFGNGTVIRTYTDPDSGNDKIEIRFDAHGEKTLLLTYAKLIKVQE